MMRYLLKPLANILIICLFHNAVASFYIVTSLLFFQPFPVFAEAFLDSAAEGQSLGSGLVSGYTIPDVDSSTGTITLTNGQVAGQHLQQNEMFQEIQPGSMDAAVSSYGDTAAAGTNVNSTVSGLVTGTSSHALAYQTLMGANTARPDISQDPIWNTSDHVLSQTSPLINDMFNGCEKKTDYSSASCNIHIDDLKTCKKTLNAQSCQVTRNITPLDVKTITKLAGDDSYVETGLASNFSVMTEVAVAQFSGCPAGSWCMKINVAHPERIISAKITEIQSADGTELRIDNHLAYSYGNCSDQDHPVYPDADIKPYLNQGEHLFEIKITEDCDGGVEYHDFYKLEIEILPDFQEDFIDNPVGCRAKVFSHWPLTGTVPAFVSSGSLNDQASTDWWQCTDAADSRTFGGVSVTSDDIPFLGDILPDPPTSPPAPICYQAQTRVPGHVVLPCFTDLDGYQVCPEFDYNTVAHDACDVLQSNSSCAYVKEECAADAVSPITGVCSEFVVTYDCGIDKPGACDANNSEQTICDSPIRCMGGECVDQPTESSDYFIKAATALQTMNQVQQDNGCDNTTGGSTAGCELFDGEAMSCQMADLSILGQVDCCNMPIEASWIDYMWLASNTWELADTSVEAYAMSEYGAGYMTADFGAWNLVASDSVFSAPVGAITETWSAITEPFTSMYDSVASMLGKRIGTDLGIEAIKQQAVQWMGEWVASVFGEPAAAALLSATTTTTGSVTSTTYSMGGSMLSSIITVVGIIYAIYQIAKMVVQLIFACTEEETKLNMLKNQKLCTGPNEIGNYCSADFFGICVA
ncbi:MAG: conjugal transfer protein TraN, partial [Methylovulum sp.]|nr:conjugal transfer protein TraN [Methylovulum sp.]